MFAPPENGGVFVRFCDESSAFFRYYAENQEDFRFCFSVLAAGIVQIFFVCWKKYAILSN